MNQFSDILKLARQKTGKSQGEFGKLLGFKQKAWSNYENGQREPSIDTFFKAVKLGGVEEEVIKMLEQNGLSNSETSDPSVLSDLQRLSAIQKESMTLTERIQKRIQEMQSATPDMKSQDQIEDLLKSNTSSDRDRQNKRK